LVPHGEAGPSCAAEREEDDMFATAGPDGFTPVAPGVRRKTLCYGSETLMAEFRLDCGFVLPLHDHPHEQTGYLVSGRLQLTVGDETREVRPGDSWSIPGGVEHRADIVEDSVAVEVFSPVREDMLPFADA
jgi:quercetin dioxygenase-like cupin family protein